LNLLIEKVGDLKMTFVKRKMKVLVVAISMLIAVAVYASMPAETGVVVVNGWYEGEEIYYLDLGPEEGVTERGGNDIYVIGTVPRLYQAQVVEFIPGEAGYSPHWNVNLVQTTEGVTVGDILEAGLLSEHYEEEGVIFDDLADIWEAVDLGLVTITRPGVVVLCPVVPEEPADAPGNTEAPEDFIILGLDDSF
jgi:hypothetical protein